MTPPLYALTQVVPSLAPPSEIQWFASLGVGGLLAGLIVVLWNRDRNASEKRFVDLAESIKDIAETSRQALVDVTRTTTTLATLIERQQPVACPYTREVREWEISRREPVGRG